MRRNIHPKLFGVVWTAFVLLLLTVLFSAAFYLTSYFYKITNLTPPAFLVQIINSFLGLIFTGLIISAFSRYFRRQQFNAFQPVIDAMERIARGDFSTRLDVERQDGIINGLVTSVNKMALELGQMENMRQEFISNVSHEIQSPLTSIRGFAQALKNERLSEQERLHYLEIIEMESTRLSRLADDLLKLASLEAEQVKFAPHPYRLDKQIRSLILTCEPQWAEKKIEMDVDLNEVSITADEDLLSQVWLNLLHNSIKFTPQGGSIKVNLCQRGDKIEFSVTDTGVGIAPEDQIHIFERFYKADKSRTSSSGGSGLGLSIVKKIVDLHKGTIDLESKLDEGTTFFVTLPME
jgi:signal transduction histidine kinase